MDIAVSVSETKVRFATPDITLTSKVIDGTFPDYSRVIPQGNTRRLEVDAAEFAKAVDRVATVSVGTVPRGEDAARRGPADPVGQRP